MLPPAGQPPMPSPAPNPAEAPAPRVQGKGGAFWRAQIDAAKRRRQQYEPWWEASLKAYAPAASKDTNAESYAQDIHTNRTFTLVERKKADLFYQRPDLTLQPTPLMDAPIPNFQGPPNPQTGQPSPVPQTYALAAHQEIVNEKLGENGIDASEMMDAVTFDIVCHQGVGFTKMGYESYTIDQPGQHPITGEPIMVPVPVAERCYWEHFSGKQAIIPATLRSTDWDRAPFLGMAFTLPLTAANRKKYKLPDDFEGTKPQAGQQSYDYGDGASYEGMRVFTGVELEYRSMLFREDISHPEHITQLVLVDGIDEPVIERDSPHQTLLPNGQLSPDSVLGYTFHPFSIRKMTDSAYVCSDGTMIRPLENELDVFRTQLVQFRDSQVLRYITTLPPEILAKITRSPIGGIITVPEEAFLGDGQIKPLEGGSVPRESFQSNDYIDNDLARTTGIDSSGAGVQSDRSSTATEQQIIASNANARMDKERGTLLKAYIKGATKFAALLMRYLPVADAEAIVGPQRAAAWDAWRKTATPTLSFTAMPDSALRVDQAVDRKQWMDFYSFMANDPFVQKGRQKLLEKGFRKFHIDPTDIVAPPDPPKPAPPSMSFSFKGEDLVGPQAPIVLGIAQQLGLQIDPGWVTLSQAALHQDQLMAAQADASKDAAAGPNTTHGGKLPQAESLSKHQADQTGALQGIGGAPSPMGAGGRVQ